MIPPRVTDPAASSRGPESVIELNACFRRPCDVLELASELKSEDIEAAARSLKSALFFCGGKHLKMSVETHRVPESKYEFRAWTIRNESNQILGYIRIP